MPLSTINNGEQGYAARMKVNAAIDFLNGLQGGSEFVKEIGDGDLVGGEYELAEEDLGKMLIFVTTANAKLILPAGLPRYWSVGVIRGSSYDVGIEAGAGATVTFQYLGDVKIARELGMVSIHNYLGADTWVVSEGTSA